MKQITLKIFALVIVATQANAQSEKFNGLALHATFGAKQLQFDNIQTSGPRPSIASSLGAGSSWNFNRIVAGTEFYYSSATSSDKAMHVSYSGFNSNLYFGYKVFKRNGWQIAPLTGIGVSRNNLSLTPKESTFSRVYNANTPYLHTSLRFEKVSAKGTYFGIKGGYNLALKTQAWQIQGTEKETNITDKLSGFYL